MQRQLSADCMRSLGEERRKADGRRGRSAGTPKLLTDAVLFLFSRDPPGHPCKLPKKTSPSDTLSPLDKAAAFSPVLFTFFPFIFPLFSCLAGAHRAAIFRE